jgi:hypothetical protein
MGAGADTRIIIERARRYPHRFGHTVEQEEEVRAALPAKAALYRRR